LREEHSLRKDVSCYIEQISNKYSSFSLIYYEINKIAAGLENCEILSEKRAYQFDEDWWNKRIWLHKAIVDNVGTKDCFPVRALFVNDFPTCDYKSSDKKGDDAEGFLKSPLRQINDYILAKSHRSNKKFKKSDSEKNSLDKANKGKRFLDLFDFICIDSAPIFSSFEKNKKFLSAETKMWGDDECDFKKLGEKWQQNTAKFQRARMGPFLHPSFMGLFERKKWVNMEYTFMGNGDTKSLFDPEEAERLRKYDSWFIGKGQIESNKVISGISFSSDFSYSKSQLSQLSVPDPHSYWEALDTPERLPMSGKLNNKEIPNDIRQKYSGKGGIFSALTGKNLQDENEKNILLDLLQDDLRICHYYFHKEIHNSFKDKLKYKWSAVIGLPLAIAIERKEEDKSNRFELPESYRGGIWIFAASNDDFSLRHETALFDLSRFAWLIFMNGFSQENARQEEKAGAERVEHSFSHEMKQIALAIGVMWMTDPGENLKKLVNQENRHLAGLDWKILPFPELYKVFGSMIRLWIGAEDVKLVFDPKPQTFKDLARACYKLALNSSIPIKLRRISLQEKEIYPTVQEEFDLSNKLLNGLDVSASDAPAPNWELPSWMNLVRLLTATFVNCRKHGDLEKGMTLTAYADGNNLVITIKNFERKEESSDNSSDLFSSNMDGIEVIKNCYAALNPSSAYNPLLDGEEYVSTFEIPLSIITTGELHG